MSSNVPHFSSTGFTANKQVSLLLAGKRYFDTMHEMIENAKFSVYLQVYIFEEDDTGRYIAEALLDAAKKGVAVWLLADAYGCNSLSRQFCQKLREGGVHFRFFQPFFKTRHFYIGRRLHHKLLVTDAQYCLIGGINIGDRYNNTAAGSPWLDFAVYAEGEIAAKACMLAKQTWAGFPSKVSNGGCQKLSANGMAGSTQNIRARLSRNDWIYGKNDISKSYKQIFTSAKSQIIILSSYFIPGKFMRKYIRSALNRGIKVKLIMAGRSDVVLAKYAERFMYAWLLRNGVEVYEYQPVVLHGKLAVCDSTMVTIGSYNINNISAYASVELNIDVENRQFASATEKMIYNTVLPQCRQITSIKQTNALALYRQFAWWLSYEFVRLLFFLFSFYVRQQHFSEKA